MDVSEKRMLKVQVFQRKWLFCGLVFYGEE